MLLVTTEGAPKTPVLVLMVTVTSDNAAFEAFNALTVIVAVVEPSDFTVVGVAERLIEAIIGPVGVGVGVVPESGPVPHP